MTAKVVYTEFPSLKTVQGELKLLTLKEFAAQCAASYGQKKQQPLCVPDILPDCRRASGVEPMSASAVFLDFDKPVLKATEAARILRKLKASFVLYPTFSWKESSPKYRIVLPFGAPQEIKARRDLIARMEKALPGIAPESYDSKRGYFVGKNGQATAPLPIVNDELPAEQVQWPTAEPAPPEARPLIKGLWGNPGQLAMELVHKHGHKLVDGEGRWSAVEYLATRVSARDYTEMQCYALLDELIGRYFDHSVITDEDRAKWRGRIAYWLAKDKPRRALQAATIETRVTPTFGGLPITFSIGELQAMDLPETQWIIEGLLPPGLALLAGPPKIGKSTLAYDLAMAVAAGTKFLDHWATRKAPVIYYDLESGHHLIKEKVTALLRARGHNPQKSKWKLSFSLVAPSGTAAITQVRADLQANPDTRLLVVDIFARFRDASQEARERKNAYLLEHELMTQFQAVCMDYPNLCILLVHHTNKRSVESWQDAISGTQGIAGGTHTNLMLAKPAKQGLPEEDRELMHQYVTLHGAGKRLQELELTLAKSGDGCTWRVSDKTPSQVKAGAVQRDIMAVVSSNSALMWPAHAVARALGRNVNTVREQMRRMAQQGMIQTTGNGFVIPQHADKAKRVAADGDIFGAKK